MRVRAALLLVPLLSACASSAPIARVEHGLVPEVRVEGDKGGWSIEERMRVHHTPAVSIAVIHDRRVVWAKAYGVTDRRTGARADEHTRFEAASISKMVTALAALLAVDAGKVALDADINRALRGWQLPENELTRKTPVTLKHLLTHTAGTNVRSVVGHRRGAPLPTLRQVLDGEPPANTAPVRVEEPPGKAFRYSGGGSLIVQQLVVDVAGKPFESAMHELVFAPLGLGDSTFEAPSERAAAAHDFDESLLPDLVYRESAAAGLWSTPSDLARILVEVQRGLAGQSAIVSRATAQRMTTPVASIGVPDVSTGMGTFVERHGDGVYFGHDGHNDGFLSVSRATVGGGDGAVVMANGAGAAQLIFEILRSIAVEYRWPGWVKPKVRAARVAPERLRALAGRYGVGADRALVVEVRGDRLVLSEPFRAPVELVAVSEDTFLSRSDETRYVFRRDGLVETAPGEAAVVLAPLDKNSTTVAPLRLVEEGREEEALERYRALAAANPDDPSVAEARFDELGSELLDHRWELERAIRVFRIEAALHPESANANAGLALAYLRAGRRAEAAPFVARALEIMARADRKPGSEVAEIYLGVRIGRLKRLAGVD